MAYAYHSAIDLKDRFRAKSEKLRKRPIPNPRDRQGMCTHYRNIFGALFSFNSE